MNSRFRFVRLLRNGAPNTITCRWKSHQHYDNRLKLNSSHIWLQDNCDMSGTPLACVLRNLRNVKCIFSIVDTQTRLILFWQFSVSISCWWNISAESPQANCKHHRRRNMFVESANVQFKCEERKLSQGWTYVGNVKRKQNETCFCGFFFNFYFHLSR